MDPAVVYALIPILSVVVGGPCAVLIAMLLFPSTREGLAKRLAGKGAGPLDDEALAHLSSTDANVTALRSEVYALRCEVAAISRALPPGSQAPALPPAATGGR